MSSSNAFLLLSFFCLFTFRNKGFLMAMNSLNPADLSQFITVERKKNQVQMSILEQFLFYFFLNNKVFISSSSCHFRFSSSFSLNISDRF